MKDNAMEELLSLKWNNHRSTFLHILAVLRDKQLYTDATLACDGKLYSVHKLVLSTCSDYFSSMLDRTSCKNPVIVLKDIKSDDLEALLDYMYLGEVNVRQSDLSTLIKAAECLRVKGLAVADDEPPPKKSKADTQSKRSESTSSPPAKRKRRSDVDDGRDDVRPSRGEHRQSSSPALSSSRPKSPSSGTYNSSKINSSNVNTRNSVEEPKNSNSSDSYVDTAPCIKVEMSDEADRPPDDESNMDGNTGDMGDELSDSYGLNSEDFKEENDQDGGDLNSDLPEFLQQATAGYQHSSFGGPSFQSDMPWQGSEDNGSGSSSSFNTAAAAAAAAQFVPQDSSSQGASGNNPWSMEKTLPGTSGDAAPQISFCPVCGKGFRGVYRKYNIKKHMTIHSGLKVFKCPYCPHNTNKKGNLKTHVLSVHNLPFDDFAVSMNVPTKLTTPLNSSSWLAPPNKTVSGSEEMGSFVFRNEPSGKTDSIPNMQNLVKTTLPETRVGSFRVQPSGLSRSKSTSEADSPSSCLSSFTPLPVSENSFVTVPQGPEDLSYTSQDITANSVMHESGSNIADN